MARPRVILRGGAVLRAVQRRIVDRVLRALTAPSRVYAPSEVTDLKALKGRLRVGDVLLISGNARISYVVKLLTLSQWSHVVLYVGNRQELLRDEERAEWLKTYGGKALEHLVIDADPLRGVHLRPLDEYVGLLIRHCRAEAITPDDLKKVVQKALGELGKTYDIKHIFRLLFFFIFPWELLPESLRRFGRDFTLSESDTICSRVLSEAFHSVGYPIRPIEVIENRAASNAKAIGVVSALRNRGRTAVRLLAGGRIKAALTRLTDERYLEFHLKASRHITPADYDLSRFFSVIKDRDDLTLDYKQIRMTTEDEEDA